MKESKGVACASRHFL